MFLTRVRSQATPFGALALVGAAVALWSQPAARTAAAPVVGKSLRYCNPLPLPASSTDGAPQGVSLGDVTVVREGDSCGTTPLGVPEFTVFGKAAPAPMH
jgi:hypothetical protein